MYCKYLVDFFWKNIKKDIEFLRKKLLVKNPLFQKVEFKKEIKVYK